MNEILSNSFDAELNLYLPNEYFASIDVKFETLSDCFKFHQITSLMQVPDKNLYTARSEIIGQLE